VRNQTRIDQIIGAVIGLVGFSIAVDPRVLNPTDVRWLLWGDSAQHYLGWEFFRDTPLIQWPIGANPAFGAGFGESIVYSDAIPLIAIPLKYVSFLLPSTFQYLGWWILLCFLLQGVLAVLLLRFAGVTRYFAAIGTVMLVLFPPFLYRLTHDGYGHIALASHWIILLSISMFVSCDSRVPRWTLVAAIALLVQPYLAIYPIVLGAWRLIRDQQVRGVSSLRSVSLKMTAFIAVPVALFWAVGGFPSGASRDTGFGVYQSTLTSLVDPRPTSSFGWSRLLKVLDFDAPSGTNEGFSFLGTGILFLLPLALSVWSRSRRKPAGDWKSLLGIATLLALLAALPTIRFGGRTLFAVPVPEKLLDIAGVFRSNGRFVWLLAYTVALLVIATVALSSHRLAPVLVSLGVVLIGFIDARPALREVRERFSDSAEPLIGERNAAAWERILHTRQHLVTIPPLNNDPQWIDMAQLARQYRMTTTAAYLSRLNDSRFQAVIDSGEHTLQRRKFPSDSVFVIMNYPPHPLADALRREALDPRGNASFRTEQIENLLVIHSPKAHDRLAPR
jgi:hypothetical protein